MDQGLSILGEQASVPESRKEAKIETFPNPGTGNDYWIELATGEFTSNCPVTNQPDFGKVSINYVPDEVCLETKSLKLYLNSFRHESCFNETAVNWMIEDLTKACSPKKITVRGVFSSRGGISVTVEANYNKDE